MPDLITVLERVREQDEPTPPAVLDAAVERSRARLTAAGLGADAGATGPRRLLRRPTVRVGIALAAAAVVVVGSVTATTLGLPGRPESAAASVLHTAAAAAGSEPAPSSPYVLVTVREDAFGYATSDGEHYDEGYVMPAVTRTWVPRDRSGTWVREQWTDRATAVYGGAAARKAAADDYAAAAHADDPSVSRASAGDFTNGELGGTPSGVLDATDLDALPRDADRLAEVVLRSPRASGEDDQQHEFQVIAGLLRTGVVPADLREAMFTVLAGLDDAQVTDRQTSLDGRTGTAIGLGGAGDSDRTEILIDPADGTYLGERTIQVRRTGSIPAGTVIGSTSVRVASADSAP